jgi:hypothetical protein
MEGTNYHYGQGAAREAVAEWEDELRVAESFLPHDPLMARERISSLKGSIGHALVGDPTDFELRALHTRVMLVHEQAAQASAVWLAESAERGNRFRHREQLASHRGPAAHSVSAPHSG